MRLIGVSHTPVGVFCFGGSAGGHDILSWLSVLLAWLLVEFGSLSRESTTEAGHCFSTVPGKGGICAFLPSCSGRGRPAPAEAEADGDQAWQ